VLRQRVEKYVCNWCFWLRSCSVCISSNALEIDMQSSNPVARKTKRSGRSRTYLPQKMGGRPRPKSHSGKRRRVTSVHLDARPAQPDHTSCSEPRNLLDSPMVPTHRLTAKTNLFQRRYDLIVDLRNEERREMLLLQQGGYLRSCNLRNCHGPPIPEER
jgi:hypothetical protein